MISTTNLAFAYAGADSPAVGGISFEVAPGEIFGFLGPSGAGKSTTQKILIGLLDGYSGNVRVLGKDRAAWTAEDAARIGVSFESPTHFQKLTGLENLRYFAALYAQSTRDPQDMLETLGLGGDGAMRVGAYSKGMKNRLSVARALLHDPELLFLDEPTAGLDPVNAQRVKEIIRAERDAGKTIFLATHDMTVADELCDRVAFIVDGTIACIDAPGHLKLAHGQRTVRLDMDDAAGSTDFPLDDLGDNAEFLETIRSGRIRTIHSREATLADVFIAVTGRGLE
jgi:fluoroquinolone transport system ATP-binding protein